MTTIDRHNKLRIAHDQHREKFKCMHEKKELRRRTLKDGTFSYVEQCIKCGHSGRAMPAKVAFEISGGQEIPDFDNSLQTEWRLAENREANSIRTKLESQDELARKEFWSWYEIYLSSEKWKSKRKKVLERAKGICEGCRENKSEEVHHLSYKNKGNEFLFELVAVCIGCHDRLHSKHLALSMQELEFT